MIRTRFKLLLGLVLLASISAEPVVARQGVKPFPFSRRARLSPAVLGPLTVDTQGDSRAVFQRIAGLAGIQVVFHRSVQPAPLPKEFVLNAVDVFEALDKLSRQTNCFWEVYDARTVLIAPDDAGTRKKVEMQVIESVDLNALTATMKRNDIAAAVRSRVSLRAMAEAPENALTFRDSADKVALAEETIVAMGAPDAAGAAAGAAAVAAALATDLAGNAYTFEEGRLKTIPAQAHASFQPKAPGVMNLRLEGNANDVFLTIAARFGFQVMFHRQFVKTTPMTLDVTEVDAVAALDLAAFQSGNFWQVLDPRTIVVATDNSTVRRDVEPLFIQTVALNKQGPEAIAQILAGLDTIMGSGWTAANRPPSPPVPKEVLEAREREAQALIRAAEERAGAAPGQLGLIVIDGKLTQRPPDPSPKPPPSVWDPISASDGEVIAATVLANGLLIRGTADRIALDQVVIALLDRQVGAIPSRNPTFRLVGGGTVSIVDLDTVQRARSQLKLKSTEPISLQMNAQSRAAFEMLAERAGLQVIFHRQFANAAAAPFSVEETDVLTALDRLSFQTGNFWRVLSPHAIVVAPDNPTVRRDAESTVVKVIYLKNVRSVEEGMRVRAALRALTGGTVYLNAATSTLVVRNVPEIVAIIEKVTAVLDGGSMSDGSSSASVGAPAFQSGVFANPASPEARRANLQSQLQLTSRVPGSIDLFEGSRKSFEALAALAGVNIVFPSQFSNSPSFSFKFSGGDFIEAFDILAFQTGNFWQLVDANLIRVATDNPTVRSQLEPVVSQTVDLKNVKNLEGLNEIVTTVGAVAAMKSIEADTSDLSNPYRIRMNGTADALALTEKIIAALDVPGRTPLVDTAPAVRP